MSVTSRIVPRGVISVVLVAFLAAMCVGCERRKQNFAGIDESAGNPDSDKKIEAHKSY